MFCSFILQSLLEPFSKLLSFVIQYGIFSLSYLVELCGLCYKAFNKVPLSVFSVAIVYRIMTPTEFKLFLHKPRFHRAILFATRLEMSLKDKGLICTYATVQLKEGDGAFVFPR